MIFLEMTMLVYEFIAGINNMLLAEMYFFLQQEAYICKAIVLGRDGFI